MNLVKYIKTYFINIRGFLYVFVSIICGALPAVSIILRSRLIDSAVTDFFTDGSTDLFFLWLILLPAVYLLEICLQSLVSYLAEIHKIKQGARLDCSRVDKISKIDFPITETKSFFTLLNKASKAAEAEGAAYQSLGDIIRLCVTAIFSVAVIIFIDIATVVGIMVLLILGVILNMRLASITALFWEKYIENTKRADYFSSLLMQKEFAAERKIFTFDSEIEKRYDVEFQNAKNKNLAAGKKRLNIEMLMRMAFAVYSGSVIFLLARPFLGGFITIGEFISVFYAAVQMLNISRLLCEQVFSLTENLKKLAPFYEFLSLPEDEGSKETDNAVIKSIEFRNVSFSYPGTNHLVLDNISFVLEGKKHYALVGANGCGKTTIVKLMLGLYSPDKGNILINGTDVKQLSPYTRHRIFSVVFQDYYKYPLTIRENVSLYSDEPLCDESISEAFEILEFTSTLELEKGYDTDLLLLKKRGTELSGGQWQKLAVARCFFSKAPIVILDEPNAALDPISEMSIYEAYAHIFSDKTTLFISHRLGSVRMADEILVLNEGRLIAKASHQKLMNSCGYYAMLYNTQRQMYEG